MNMDYNNLNVKNNNNDLYNINNAQNINNANKAASAGAVQSFQQQETDRISEAYLGSNTNTVEKTKLDNMEIREQLTVHNIELNKMEKGSLYISDDKVGSVDSNITSDFSLENTISSYNINSNQKQEDNISNPASLEDVNKINVQNAENREKENEFNNNEINNTDISNNIPDGVTYNGNAAMIMAGLNN